MDVLKIYSDADFANAVVKTENVLLFASIIAGKPVIRYKNANGAFNTIGGGDGTDGSIQYAETVTDADEVNKTVQIKTGSLDAEGNLQWSQTPMTVSYEYTVPAPETDANQGGN